MSAHTPQRRDKAQQGVAALEFAMIIPVLLLVLYGIVMLAFVMVSKSALTHGASEGARMSIAEPPDNFTRTQIAENVCNGSIAWLRETVGTDNAYCSASVMNPCAADNPYACMKVSAVYLYENRPLIPTLPLVSSFAPQQLDGSAVSQIGVLSQ